MQGRAALDEDARARSLNDAYVICELAVEPAEQGRGLGRELVERVLARPSFAGTGRGPYRGGHRRWSEAVRARSGVAILGAAVLVLTACGDETPDDDAGAQERIAELEDELEQVRQDSEELLAENERLLEELRLLTADDPDGDTDTDDTDEEPAEEEPAEEEPQAAPAEPQQIRTPEGLNEQLRTLFDRGDGPEGDWEPGTTEWSSADLPPGLDDSYDSPGALAFDLAAALDAEMLGMDSWETTTRVLMDPDDPDLAYVAVLSWGFADDSVTGRDLRMTITGDQGTWSPGGAEHRFHCARGVDDDLCV